jgi:hypothetical protein
MMVRLLFHQFRLRSDGMTLWRGPKPGVNPQLPQFFHVRPTSRELYVKQLLQIKFKSLAKAFFVR